MEDTWTPDMVVGVVIVVFGLTALAMICVAGIRADLKKGLWRRAK